MPKLQECQFIKIEIDGKSVGGTSEEKDYTGWMEGYCPIGLSAFSNVDGIYFDSVQLSLLVTKDTGNFYEQILKRGYKNLTFTIVNRGSDKFDQNYEVQRTVYSDCKIYNMTFERTDEDLFMNLSMVPEGTVEVTFNVPNSKDNGIDKIGPTKYSIHEKKLM
ncbi:hypothetical protein DVH07_18295 [Hafnia paralvei]|uniref:hypothetical protein n=1 Tax=Hafnia paralvei TaxID=546367 RepID=UPI000DF4064B|nr:hypothetical protein [Hafnia paralvei]RDA61900.1 hypothetical protein DU449_17855 [Hafnia paralvei]RDA62961.1 hypothetical protein DVH08_20065 [Hafnia paralvei]RDA63801.1 hypothetical protein DVH09_18425 [Hafnia paralvei]RDA75087.1 hypothetical protein DVH10_17595 [Hafnia paralvei]RDA75491.1 hypothetical protein DVH07_18295 [Hafnia paralvei]